MTRRSPGTAPPSSPSGRSFSYLTTHGSPRPYSRHPSASIWRCFSAIRSSGVFLEADCGEHRLHGPRSSLPRRSRSMPAACGIRPRHRIPAMSEGTPAGGLRPHPEAPRGVLLPRRQPAQLVLQPASKPAATRSASQSAIPVNGSFAGARQPARTLYCPLGSFAVEGANRCRRSSRPGGP